ncbi:hypothetical protein N7G274_006287 [Stereocaulon virgatum]|uniref:3-keto-steroid reductase n=1 Tax=Stereocaulon virgatum TaxID=373712 RepID=A0ABR4A4J5_9LECA
MQEVLHPRDNEQHSYILVTGANSGVGLATCCRLINEFVTTHPSFECLTLIVTTRSSDKSKDTIRRLEQHLERQSKDLDTPLKHRISLQPEQLDLTSLRSVQTLANRLIANLPHLDVIICNAGYGSVTGVNWPVAMWTVCTDLVNAITYPSFKISSVGETTAPQQMSTTECSSTSSSLGKVFTSNVFGHYILSHFLVPLLSASPDHGRMILVSSIEALPSHLDPIDIQALKSNKAYESSKRLADVLALTSSLPSTKPFVQRFLSGSSSSSSKTIKILDNEPEDPNADTRDPGIVLTDNEYRAPASSSPRIYICHPGICATSIVPLPLILYYCMMAAFYSARWIGSPWHTVSAYKGACAPVWLALADKEELEDMEQTEGKGKWGSSCDRTGHERVMRTVVGGWGLGGKMGEPEMANRKGTRPGTREVTKEDREGFEELGRECWRQMEALRVEWEARIKSE